MIIAPESVDEDGNPHPHQRYSISSIDYILSDKNGNVPGVSIPQKADTGLGFKLIRPDYDEKPMLRPRIIDIH